MNRWLPWLWLTVAMAGCGGGAPEARADSPRPPAAAPSGPVKSLQLYLVLTPDPGAMQGKPATDAMWAAVRGQDARYKSISDRTRGVPDDYQLDIVLDYADWPHPMLDARQISELVSTLPPDAQKLAGKARLGVLVRSDTVVLPAGAHIRLAGTVPLYVADKWGGVILNLIGRRAWTADAWRAELAGAALSPAQVRLVTRAEDDGTRWLLTRGNPKFGLPDLEMRHVDATALDTARSKFMKIQENLLKSRREPPGLTECTGPKGLYDAGCKAVAKP